MVARKHRSPKCKSVATQLKLLRNEGANKMVDRLEYLLSDEDIETDGDAPAPGAVSSFIDFYLDNADLQATGKPLLASGNGKLQAVWTLTNGKRLTTDFIEDGHVRFIYRDQGDMENRFTGYVPHTKLIDVLREKDPTIVGAEYEDLFGGS